MAIDRTFPRPTEGGDVGTLALGIETAILVVEVLEDGTDVRCLSVNETVVRWSGWPAERWLGRRPADLLEPETAAAACARAAAVVQSGQSGACEHRLHLPAGDRWVQTTLTPIPDAAGRITRLVISSVDVTNRMQAEEALARAHAFHGATLALLPLPLIFMDAERHFFQYNHAALECIGKLGLAQDEAAEFLDPHTLAPIAFDRMPVVRALAGEVVRGEEYLMTAPGSDLRVPVLISAAPIELDGQIVAAVSVLQDITAVKAADRAKDEFLTLLSHELQTPLTSILGWSTEALRRRQPGLTERAMEVIHRNALRQKRLVGEILEMSHLLHRKITLALEPLDLGAQAADAVENLQLLAAERQLTLALEPPAGPLPIHADPIRLQQCIGNLLHNSLKFTPPGGAVTVRCRRDGDCALLSVQDTGRGLTPAALATLFQPFHQVNRDERHGGLGLGLALTRGIIELHNGRLTADSPGPHHGSTFTLTLPLRP